MGSCSLALKVLPKVVIIRRGIERRKVWWVRLIEDPVGETIEIVLLHIVGLDPLIDAVVHPIRPPVQVNDEQRHEQEHFK